MADWCSHTTLMSFCLLFLQTKTSWWTGQTDVTTEIEFTFPTLCWCNICRAHTHPSLSIFFIHPSQGAFNHIVMKESTLTYITMLINRTFPFCRRSQRATLNVSVAESPHSLGPIHVFPMLQFTHWIRLGPKKCFSPNYHLARRRGGLGWGVRYLSLFTSAALFPLFLSLRE